jgi:hypothetical protein
MNTNQFIEVQSIINATKSPWINFYNYHAAFHAIQKIQDPQLHRHFKAVLVQIALTGKAYALNTEEYL